MEISFDPDTAFWLERRAALTGATLEALVEGIVAWYASTHDYRERDLRLVPKEEDDA